MHAHGQLGCKPCRLVDTYDGLSRGQVLEPVVRSLASIALSPPLIAFAMLLRRVATIACRCLELTCRHQVAKKRAYGSRLCCHWVLCLSRGTRSEIAMLVTSTRIIVSPTSSQVSMSTNLSWPSACMTLPDRMFWQSCCHFLTVSCMATWEAYPTSFEARAVTTFGDHCASLYNTSF